MLLAKKKDSSLDMTEPTVDFNVKNNYEVNVLQHGNYLIECKTMQNKNMTVIFNDVFTILPRDMSKLIEDSLHTYKTIQTRTKSSEEKTRKLFNDCEAKARKPSLPMNILIINIDSFSHNHFRRMLPLTDQFLRSLGNKSTIFDNFVVVGENTKPNLFPFLTGKLVERIPEKWLFTEEQNLLGFYHDYNKYPFFWKDFEKLGYLSMLNEDYLKNGNGTFIYHVYSICPCY